jgi:hypothetical protein
MCAPMPPSSVRIGPSSEEHRKLYADLSKKLAGGTAIRDEMKQQWVLDTGERINRETVEQFVTITKTSSGLVSPRPEFSVPIVCKPRTVLRGPAAEHALLGRIEKKLDVAEADLLRLKLDASLAAFTPEWEKARMPKLYGPASAHQPPSWLTRTLAGLWWTWRTRKQRRANAKLPQRPWEGVSGPSIASLPLLNPQGL